MLQTNTSLTFKVRRQAPELITPAVPTPRELKLLSDIDDQNEHRYQVPTIQFFPRNPEMEDKNPAAVIREALAKVLVFYYPFAGRLREGSGRKLMVDCTAEGALFTEAEADVTLEEFGDRLHPPFPCIEELLYDIPGSNGILDAPLLLIQVTRLSCGGFIFASRMNHTMCDGQGAMQFLIALGEIARCASQPSILPVWERELLFARDPPHVNFTDHPEYKEKPNSKHPQLKMDDQMTQKTFLFRPSEISALRRFVPDDIKTCTTNEILTASIWRCRTIALEPNPEQEMRFMFPVNARAKLNPPLPIGYYGNCVVHPLVRSTARDLSTKPLAHALRLVMSAKSIVTEEFVRSTVDLLAIRRWTSLNFESTYAISNLTRVGFNEINFGWGKATYAGPAFGGFAFNPEIFSYLVSSTNSKGESGIMISLSLPKAAMEKFMKELNKMLIYVQ
uniref:benzyl alcohol O-benzoyltransferase-like n=1 Tax=Erigeron canadensis TaxID=72917 RepID=UPI001CB9D30E|nr:benzyl alcohol O-benzoyltransferase-like [Erigeron canadensis]